MPKAECLLVRFNDDGLGMSLTILGDDGRLRPPQPLSGEGYTELNNPALNELAQMFSAKVVEQRDAVIAELEAANKIIREQEHKLSNAASLTEEHIRKDALLTSENEKLSDECQRLAGLLAEAESTISSQAEAHRAEIERLKAEPVDNSVLKDQLARQRDRIRDLTAQLDAMEKEVK